MSILTGIVDRQKENQRHFLLFSKQRLNLRKLNNTKIPYDVDFNRDTVCRFLLNYRRHCVKRV